MSERRAKRSRRGAALISMVAILVIVTAFAAIFLSTHAGQVAIEKTSIYRVRAEASALAGTQLALWRIKNDADLQAALARVVAEGDTSPDADPLFNFTGDISGTDFDVDVWPGDTEMRLRSIGVSGGVHFERWARMALVPDNAPQTPPQQGGQGSGGHHGHGAGGNNGHGPGGNKGHGAGGNKGPGGDKGHGAGGNKGHGAGGNKGPGGDKGHGAGGRRG